MNVLWAAASASVAEVRERLTDDLAYTTVLTILRTLEQKGYVGHTGEGRAYRYRPLVRRAAAGRTALRRPVKKGFAGSPEPPLAPLVPATDLPGPELRPMPLALRAPPRGREPRAR